MATINVKNFPDELYQRIKKEAETENRSVSQQVIFTLREGLTKPQPLSILKLRGLGKELWRTEDTTAFARNEREGWED